MPERLTRLPADPVAQVRADVRRLGERRGAERWGLTPRIALRVAARLPVPRSAAATIYRQVLAGLEGRRRG